MNAAWSKALRWHRPLLIAALFYCVAVITEAIYAGAQAADFVTLLRYIVMAFSAACMFVAGICAGAGAAFLLTAPKGMALQRIDIATKKYVTSERFAATFFGFIVLATGNFFLFSKSLIASVNPLVRMEWDVDFAAWDKWIHFGSYPHQYIIPLVNRLNLGIFLDRAYYGWLVVMTMVAWFCIFADMRLHRRLRFLWVYFLSWALLGTLAATIFSSAGPLFYATFFNAVDNPYEFITVNMRGLHQQSSLFADTARRLLLRWHNNSTLFDPNAISAMPSMHIALCWLFVLYAREFGKMQCLVALGFCAVIFTGAVYFGFHYAVDGYVSIMAVSLLWWGMGKHLDRHYPRQLELRPAP